MKRLIPFLLAGALSVAAVAPASAATCTGSSDRGGAAALIALVNANVQVGAVNVCEIDVLNNSLNNLLQNADIHVLENILNNSPILSYNDITVTFDDVLNRNVVTISVLSAPVLVITGL